MNVSLSAFIISQINVTSGLHAPGTDCMSATNWATCV
jgi:hypothetical protein